MDELIDTCIQSQEEIEKGKSYKAVDSNCFNRLVGKFFVDEKKDNVELNMDTYLGCIKLQEDLLDSEF